MEISSSLRIWKKIVQYFYSLSDEEKERERESFAVKCLWRWELLIMFHFFLWFFYLPNRQRTLNKLPTELRLKNFVNKHRLSIQNRRQTCKNRLCNVYMFRLSFHFLHATVGGWVCSSTVASRYGGHESPPRWCLPNNISRSHCTTSLTHKQKKNWNDHKKSFLVSIAGREKNSSLWVMDIHLFRKDF